MGHGSRTIPWCPSLSPIPISLTGPRSALSLVSCCGPISQISIYHLQHAIMVHRVNPTGWWFTGRGKGPRSPISIHSSPLTTHEIGAQSAPYGAMAPGAL